MSRTEPEPESAPANEPIAAPEPRELLEGDKFLAHRSCTESIQIAVSIESATNAKLRLDGGFSTDTVPYSREGWFGFVRWRIEFGLTGGELEVRLRNCKAPLRFRYNFEMAETYTTGGTFTRERQMGVSPEIGFELSKGPTVKVGGAWNEKRAYENKFEYALSTVHAAGPDDRPIWKFESPNASQPLRGQMRGLEPPLAYLTDCTTPIEAFAEFRIRPSEIYVVNIHPWNFRDDAPPDLSIKKREVLKKAVIDQLWEESKKEEDGQLVLAFSTVSLGDV